MAGHKMPIMAFTQNDPLPDVRYEPQEDITAYELALLIPYLTGVVLTNDALATLGAAGRHFRRKRKGEF